MSETATAGGAEGARLYRVTGDWRYRGEVGVMVARFADPSYNDIQLEFSDGARLWFHVADVEKVTPAALQRAQAEGQAGDGAAAGKG